jgi:hypothetical protein
MDRKFKTAIKLLFWLFGVPALAGIFLYVSAQRSFEIGQWEWGVYHLIVLIVYEIIAGLILKDEILECLEK